MVDGSRPLAVVTGASTGIGFELAMQCAQQDFDLLIAADEPSIHEAAEQLQRHGGAVAAVEADLSTAEGVARLLAAAKAQGRPIHALLANAGRGLGNGFLNQDFEDAMRVINTNITGTLCLLHCFGRDMCEQGFGKILITGAAAGVRPGSFQAVYNGTKAFLDTFSHALRDELKDSGVTVTCLMPGPTDTAFVERAGMLDTRIGKKKDDPVEVAREGFEAMMQGEGGIIYGFKNEVPVAVSRMMSSENLAARQSRMGVPGTARKQPTK